MFDTHHLSAYEPDSLDLRRQLRSRGPHLEDLLTREQAAAQLKAAGYPIQEKTLATKASRGGGPVYRLFNRRALYRWADVLEWARNGMTPPRNAHEVGSGT